MNFQLLLNWHLIIAAISGILLVLGEVTYIKDTLRGEARPNAVSFFLWTVLQAIALTAQISAGASWSVVLVFFVTLTTAFVTILAISGYGYHRYGKTDFYCFIFALVAIVLWQITGNPVLAIVFAIVGDIFASWPTIVKTYRDPHSESLSSWGLFTVASIFGVFSTELWDAANLAFPVYLAIISGTIFFLAYFRGGRKAGLI